MRLTTSVYGRRKLLASPAAPLPAHIPWLRCCSLSVSLSKPLTAGPTKVRPITVAAAAITFGTDGNGALHSSIQKMSLPQQEQISLYVQALLEWNQRMNLTAVTEEGEIMSRHVEDSLAIIPPLRRHYAYRCRSRGGIVGSDCGHLRVVDVGTGAGLPGMILAIACPADKKLHSGCCFQHPDWKLTLLESMQKRCSFLEHAIGLIGLSNVEVLRDRAECVGQNVEFREVFDVAVARAVAEMRTLAEYCLPLVRVGGLFVAAKGYNPQEEVENARNAMKLLGASVIDLCSVESQGPHGRRTAVVCHKTHATPKRYPRPPGIPSKKPL